MATQSERYRICVDNPPGHRIPAWQRTSFLETADGPVYGPAIILGNEVFAWMAASWDGVSGVQYRGHTYLPVEWMAKEDPSKKAVCEAIETRARAAYREHFQ